MSNKQLYGRTFQSKREFFRWLEANEDNIDWDEDIELSWYYKEEDSDD